MALQYTPIMFGVMLVVAVGTFAYSWWNSNSQPKYSYEKSKQFFEYECGYDSKPKENVTTGERKRKRKTLEQCSICLDELINNVKTLPCQHAFHQRCITAWFLMDHTEKTCPICRKTSKTTL